MRIYPFVLTAAIALFGCVPALPTRPTSTTSNQDALQPERFLQGSAAANQAEKSIAKLADQINKDEQKAAKDALTSLVIGENQLLEKDVNDAQALLPAKRLRKKKVTPDDVDLWTAAILAEKFGERELIETLVAIKEKNVAKTLHIANRLLKRWISYWVAVAKEERDQAEKGEFNGEPFESKVFDMLFPSRESGRDKLLLSDSLFDVWEEFMGLAHGWHRNQEMAAVMAEKFDEAGLRKMLVAAKKDQKKGTVYKATVLENGQTRYWQVRYSGVEGAVDLFKKLYSPETLQEPGYGMFVTPQFKWWAKFATGQGLTVEKMAEIMEKKFSNEFFFDYLSEAAKREDDSDEYAIKILKHLTAPYDKFLTPEFKGRLKFAKDQRASVQQMAEDMEAEFDKKDLIGYLHYAAKLEGDQPGFMSEILEYLTAPYNRFVLPEFQHWAVSMAENGLSVRQVAEHWLAEKLPADVAKTDVINYLRYAAGRKDDQRGFAREILKYLTKPED